ncbi:MAG: glycoside hydrolase family 18 protein [Candidatus Saccharimonas sp.]|nr:glycoside hydrolase family 18 protein [Planctomycetaceae bacterium]
MNAKNFWLLAVVTLYSAIATQTTEAQTQPVTRGTSFRVVGYLPDYRVGAIDPAVGRQLTDLVFFSVKPMPTGQFESKTLDDAKTTSLLKRFRDEHGVKIHLCVGGWDRSQGFAEIAASVESRRLFAKGLLAFCRQHHFDGVDLDWEHPKDDTESKNYGALLSEIARVFKPHKLRLTAAMAAWQTLTAEGIAAVDAIHLMSYDNPGRHSTFETSQADVAKFRKLGVPASKLCLGLPFYGRGITAGDRVKTYSEIVAPIPPAPETDEADGLFFNGPATIRRKTQFAIEQKLGGVMVWEIGQDAKGDASLLRVIDEAKTGAKRLPK